ncbi:DNA-processing protein DprA [Lactobacillus kefiranofaciens]|uniref:DNA processing protein n=1 Tax=Lactobacillus kefiranofaciens TaxID=267818 RepID=A0AAX3UF56_9LACO|nr:DNA-processing protein DprA [Lactobacillus kefiranofaciens]AEG40383.1 DNA processing protein chain A [Lactobacillus kefiranofaciens subsp. kefiranofaciens]MCJ2172095.1 DNA-processing protein DprA [Lactobacillus kefiranofaciens]MDF4142098.1 DNA-processing protein DprA [Lactobacillus kefiranofaciens]QFQ67923.1 DNA-protecting protein DprA [Lactobacillus kefiranofaciens subsp. kefiranofaciens]QNT43359.1 DNA-protecting protein DprA [Lactobacillus kefiranofaciens]
MKKTEFLLKLKLQKGIGYVKLLTIAQKMDANLEISIEEIEQMDLPEKLIQACLCTFKDPDLERLKKQIYQQSEVISFFDDEYPEKLRQMYRPPLVLFARGDLSLLQKEIITIVGSRYPTNYSKNVINRLVPNLLEQNYVIASGLAKGVDALAHQAVLNNEGRTIAVVGNGLNYSYPKQNCDLQKEITQKGLLISEYLPDTPPRPFRFPERNRILAGLSTGVIVTEAKEKSGSLITASIALQENRDIYAVPGPITSQLSAGPNQLIEAGATPIVDFKFNCGSI